MFKKLEEVEKNYERVQASLSRPDVAEDQKQFQKLIKEMASLEKVVKPYRQFKKAKSDLDEAKEIIMNESDEELRAMAKEEVPALEKMLSELEMELKLSLLPKDPNDEKNIILEIRSGAGGDEAALFAEELFRAYTLFAKSQGWRMRVMAFSEGNQGGMKEIVGEITGDRVFSHMKFEAGVHRVQRVPKTETQGRVHTSTVTVAVIPEVEEVDIKVDQKDLRIDVFRSSGNGGQSVNTTDSAVRITHIPTNTVVTCQDGKSQLSNKEQAMKVLLSRLQQVEDERKQKEASDSRMSQIGTGDRSERIRTYNFPQTRVTDHRIGLTVHNLPNIMNGEMDQVVEALISHYQAEALKAQSATN